LRALNYGIVKPLVHEIAQRYPRTFALTDSLIGQSHCLYLCADAHAFSLLEESNLTGAKVSKALPDLEAKAEGDSSMD